MRQQPPALKVTTQSESLAHSAPEELVGAATGSAREADGAAVAAVAVLSTVAGAVAVVTSRCVGAVV